MWCIQTIDSEYRDRMYDILNLYEEDYDPKNLSSVLTRNLSNFLGIRELAFL